MVKKINYTISSNYSCSSYTLYFGEAKMEKLLILSQVILSLQLGFAVIPLIHFVSNKKLMGEFVATKWLIIPAWISAAIIVGLNGKLVYATIEEWINASANPIVIWITVVPITIAIFILLFWITVRPLIGKAFIRKNSRPHEIAAELTISVKENYNRIAVCVDFSSIDEEALSRAIQQGGKQATYLLIHITETAGARLMNSETGDFETEFDEMGLKNMLRNWKAVDTKQKPLLDLGIPK